MLTVTHAINPTVPARELEPPGEFGNTRSYAFEFNNVEMPYESYNGVNVRLKCVRVGGTLSHVPCRPPKADRSLLARYMIRVTIVRQYSTNITQNFRFWVRNVQAPPEVNNSIKMEVGIEDCLHIEFEYAKSKYSLKARVVATCMRDISPFRVRFRRRSCAVSAQLVARP